MKMSMTGQMRMEQRMKLAPRMIQSMEVLQLPLLALQEKIEAELNSNPVLEQVENKDSEQPTSTESDAAEAADGSESGEKELVVSDDSNNAEDFERLDNLGSSYDDYMDTNAPSRFKYRGETDKKMEALANTAALEQSLDDFLKQQWRLIDADEPVKLAGDVIIDYIDEKGYLIIRLEQLHNKDKNDFNIDNLRTALSLIQKLEPTGVGARDLKECLLIQMGQSSQEMSFEIQLVSKYLDELLENHLPQIAKKMKCTVEQVYEAIRRMSKLDTSPGLQVGRNDNHPITADVIVEYAGDGEEHIVHLTDTRIPNLRVNNFYMKMAKNRGIDIKTRDFLQQNIRSAQWLMDAIEQRKHTLLKVARAVVKHQSEFFDKGKFHLKPLPMAKIADEVGVHIATVSRAVAGKYLQCSQGVLPLRGFFSGGTEDANGKSHSWDAVRAQIQQIVDNEDKSKPLNDDEIRDKLLESGIKKLARRTVAKYRKLLNIPAARFRKKF